MSISTGVYHNPCRTTEQSNSNHVDMLFALFVFCSFLFGNVRSVFVLKISLKACKSAEYCACSFCSVKKEIPLTCKFNQKNVVGGVFKCGQILYTWLFTSHNIYRSIRKGALFFISAPHKVPVIDAHSDYTNAVVFFYNSKYKSLCKATRIVTAFSFTRLKTMLPVSLY